MKILKNNLGKLLEERGQTIYTFAKENDMFGMKNQIYQYKLGKIMPSIEMAIKISTALGVPIKEIWYYETKLNIKKKTNV